MQPEHFLVLIRLSCQGWESAQATAMYEWCDAPGKGRHSNLIGAIKTDQPSPTPAAMFMLGLIPDLIGAIKPGSTRGPETKLRKSTRPERFGPVRGQSERSAYVKAVRPARLPVRAPGGEPSLSGSARSAVQDRRTLRAP
uniref:Uncharacterized protein n=1 Tax=Branchiostoma floridae TaxID=7739 RepID=C3YN02_BRAFL|eukprot:XP_002602309.1 hypothetical protein BRAFLDRAFT_94323 [Branchiostoma floridae]